MRTFDGQSSSGDVRDVDASEGTSCSELSSEAVGAEFVATAGCGG